MSGPRIIAKVFELEVSSRTVQRRLVEANLFSKCLAKKPFKEVNKRFNKIPIILTILNLFTRPLYTIFKNFCYKISEILLQIFKKIFDT